MLTRRYRRRLPACVACVAVVLLLVLQGLLLRSAAPDDGAGTGGVPLPTARQHTRRRRPSAPPPSPIPALNRGVAVEPAPDAGAGGVPLPTARQHTRRLRPSAPPPLPAPALNRGVAVEPAPDGAAVRRRAELVAALRKTGEALGRPTGARLAIVMPVRDPNLPSALRNVESWALRRRPPCVDPASRATADLAFLHSQSFEGRSASRSASDLDAALRRSGGACFGAVRFLAARVPLELDVYTIVPTHNFSGPNRHFLAVFRELRRLRSLQLARYTHFQLMETDTYPLTPGWARKLAEMLMPNGGSRGGVQGGYDEVGGGGGGSGGGGSPGRAKPWVRGGLSICLSPADGDLPEHINGNALYTLEPPTFYEHLQTELRARMHTWAFDVLIGAPGACYIYI